MNDEKEARDLNEYARLYYGLMKIRTEKRRGWWPMLTVDRIENEMQNFYQAMLMRIPAGHYVAIDEILKQSNISHYGN